MKTTTVYGLTTACVIIASLAIFSNSFLITNEVDVITENVSQNSNQDEIRITEFVLRTNPDLDKPSTTHLVNSVFQHSLKYSVDPILVLSIIYAESRFRPSVSSHYGAKGLMQVVPRWHLEKLDGRDPYDIDVNIDVGTMILRECMKKTNYRVHRALTCYSGGADPETYNRQVLQTRTKIFNFLK